MQLEGLRVVVTGSSSGIGRAIALACARAGADVTIHCPRSQQAAEAVAAEVRALGRRAHMAQADITLAGDVRRLVDEAQAAHGQIDVWVNNAGADILTGAAADWNPEQRLDLLLEARHRPGVVQHVRRQRQPVRQAGGGQIINMAWDHVVSGLGTEEGELYSAAKGAIWAFSKSFARSQAPRVRVNVLAPGWLTRKAGEILRPEIYQRIAGRIPLNRWASPEDIAAAAVFLASPAAAYITGQTINVNGGQVM